MEAYRALCPGFEASRTPEDPHPSPDPKRRLLRLEERLPVAVTSPRVPPLEDRLPLLPPVANQRHLRKTQRGAARAITELFRQEPAAQRGHRRLPVGQDHRGWWTTEGLRRGQEKVRGRKRHLLVDTEGLVQS